MIASGSLAYKRREEGKGVSRGGDSQYRNREKGRGEQGRGKGEAWGRGEIWLCRCLFFGVYV
jgi:hypothetical protein